MNENRLHKVENLFIAGLELSPAQRESFWISQCGGDKSLLSELHQLLQAHESAAAGDILERTAWALNEVNSYFSGESLIGKSVNDYQILQSLGQGAMGDVYLAKKPPLTRKVVIKIVGDVGNAAFRKQFIAEMRVHEKLRHENIVLLLDAGTYGLNPYIVLEYFPGQSLRQYLLDPSGRQRFLPFEHVVTITRQLTEGLGYAHREHHITHRDIKPENILILPEQSLKTKIIDFGIAILPELEVLRDDLLISRRFSYGASGTPHYMSPEQIGNLMAKERVAKIDSRTDVFALGLVVYEMLTGQSAFTQGIVRNYRKIIAPTKFREGLPSAVDGVIRKVLSEHVDQRYQSVEDFFLELEEALSPALDARKNARPPRQGGLITKLLHQRWLRGRQ